VGDVALRERKPMRRRLNGDQQRARHKKNFRDGTLFKRVHLVQAGIGVTATATIDEIRP
jgi:hypothetical protein